MALLSGSHAADPLKTLSRRLYSGFKSKTPMKIGVVRFVYDKGRVSSGSSIVSERLVTYLVQNGAVVVERALIEKILQEKKLLQSGIVNVSSLKKFDGVLGVDALVVGTLSDLSDTATEVEARVIRTDTGEVLAAATVIIPREWEDNPKLPVFTDTRVAVPVAYPLGSAVAAKPRRYQLADTEEAKKRRRYYPAPVPALLFKGGRAP